VKAALPSVRTYGVRLPDAVREEASISVTTTSCTWSSDLVASFFHGERIT
jgi:hypothetical protein